MSAARLAIALILAAGGPLAAQETFKDQPAFSLPEQPARAPAQCGTLRAQADGLPPVEGRIDLALVGTLTQVRTDGALWYLVACTAPAIRVMCVTYESNEMKAGDRVLLRGAYSRVDPDHAVLDPCLASSETDAPQ